jgi:thioredoxin reductase (NADPH)
MVNNKTFDVIIIGSGPIGLACALEAKQKNLQCLVIEKGCLVNSIYNYPANMTFFSNAKPTRTEALEYYRRVATSAQLDIHLFEEVKEVIKNENEFEVVTKLDKYISRNIIVATGFYDIPYLLNVPGEDLPKVTHYYKEPHFYAFQNVLVVGANNSAVDAALETYRKGANVTMVIRDEEVGRRVKYWARPDIVNRIEEGSIKAFFKSTVTAIRPKEVDIQTLEGIVTIANDWVIAMTGYQPNLSFLQKLGIQLSDDEVRKPAYDDNSHETNVKGIFLAGVICGGMNTHRLFIENSREHAVKIILAIAGN